MLYYAMNTLFQFRIICLITADYSGTLFFSSFIVALVGCSDNGDGKISKSRLNILPNLGCGTVGNAQ